MTSSINRIGVVLALAAAFLFASVVHAAAPEKATAKPGTDKADYAPPDVTAKKFTGDPIAEKRRQIRVLVPYSKSYYFLDRATQRGLTYEVFKLFEDDLNKKLKNKHLRVHVLFVPVARDRIIPGLIEGLGDIGAGNLTITPERLKQVDFSDPAVKNVSEIVVTGPGAEPVATAQDLSGKEVYIRKSSSFFSSVEKLNAELAKSGKPAVKIRLAPENLETEDILEMVNAGLVKITIADARVAEFWKQIFTKITLHPDAAVRTGGEIGWMIRKNSPQLKAELNAYLAKYPEGSKMRNQLFQKYLKSTKFAKEATSNEEIKKFERTIEFFRKYGDQYDMDYLLLMAQGYQESQLNQNAKSAVGAVGVMQLMPATGKDMNVGDIHQVEPNINAGVKYMRFMMDQFYANEPMDKLNKGLFIFASYNAGPGRIQQLRREAAKRGLDPNVWFNNVELVAAQKIGRETVQYVANIYKYYLAYTMIEEQRQERAKAKGEVKGQAK
jgi:membrane-bound lytic murein transglycosylase MltF